MNIADAVAALTIGLTGSTHCVAMCGGIAAALNLGVERDSSARLPILAGFHLGRILSYTLIALLLGGLAAYAGERIEAIGIALRLLAGLLLVAMGLYVAAWWTGLRFVERLGAPLWSALQPAAGKLLPVRTPGAAMALGGLWGWLPCGLIYSTLAWALSAGHAVEAAGRMFCFGLGTLPALLGVSALGEAGRHWLQGRQTRRWAGLALILYGCWTLQMPLQQLISPSTHHHHGHHAGHPA